MLREATTKVGALLILDEVMTSRLAPGGLQQVRGIKPDLTTFGKYIGGGMSFGAFGGRADIMDLFDPRRPDALPHAGTFNNNVLTMAAGLAGLNEVYTPDAARALNARGDALRERLNALCRPHDAPMQFTGIGSMFAVHFTRDPVRSPADAAKGDAKLKELFFFDMLEQGIWLARRGMFTLCLPIGDAECGAWRPLWRSSCPAGGRCYPRPSDQTRTTTKETSMRKQFTLTRRHVLLGTAGTLFAPAIARAATRGVSDSEIIIGCMADLSGVTAVQGVNNADGMRMAFDEVNAKGGVNGRKIRFIVEDKEYTVPKAVQAMNKLLNRDNIFFAVGNGGTPMNDAVMPAMFEKNVPNVFPHDMRALDVRAVQPIEVRPVLLVLRPDARRREAICRDQGHEDRRRRCTRTPISAATCWPARRRRSRRWG